MDPQPPKPGQIVQPANAQTQAQPVESATVPAVAAPSAEGKPLGAKPKPQPVPADLASFWQRVGASVIDLVGIVVITSPLRLLSVGSSSGPTNSLNSNTFGINFFIIFITWAVFLVYNAMLVASAWQATVGKRLLNLRVVDVSGSPVKPGQAFFREGCKLVSLLPLGLGFLLPLVDSQRQALHDKIAQTLVKGSKLTAP